MFKKDIGGTMAGDFKSQAHITLQPLVSISEAAAARGRSLLQRRGFCTQPSEQGSQSKRSDQSSQCKGKKSKQPSMSSDRQRFQKMDIPDITIVYAQDGHEWEMYIDKCFHQLNSHISVDRPLHIHSEMLEQITLPLSPKKIEYVRKSRAQLIIMTPEFLDFIHDHCDMLIGQMFDPTRVIAILCGIENKDIEDTHRAELISFNTWHKMTIVDQDKEFMRQLFCKTTELMELTEESEAVQNPKFKLTPRKVREGCNKVYALLKSQVLNDEEIKVYLRFGNGIFREIPFTKRNPYTIQFLVPENFVITSQIISVQITCDGISMGIRQLKCESQMGELTHLLNSVNDPMAFLCQTLGYSEDMTKELDLLLASSFKKNLPEGLHILHLRKEVQSRKCEEEMPTVLHFAAQYGLKELCSLLLDCPGAKIACNIRNGAGYCPAELAEMAGHQDLAHMLENFAKLTVTADLYSMISCASEETNPQKAYDSLYDYPSSVPLYDSPFPIPIPVPSSSPIEENDYLPMSCSTVSIEPQQRLLLSIGQTDTESIMLEEQTDIECLRLEQAVIKVNESDTISDSATTTASRFQGNTQSQAELLELLDDFKNNKFSLSEVEQLFEDWKLRQASRTFKEKEEQLAELRTRYDEIQQVAPEKGKKALAMEKIVSLFSTKSGKKPRMNSSKVDSTSNQKLNVLGENESSNTRPASTFSIASVVSSISSSSSSDRGSCVSNYDSGTLSDSGDDHVCTQKPIVDQLERIGNVGAISNQKKKLSSSIKEHMTNLDPLLPPPIPSNDRHVSPPRNGTSLIGMKYPKKPLTPLSSSNALRFMKNIEERKPLPPPRPDRVMLPKSVSEEDILFTNTSPDYVTPDPDFCIYQIPVSPPQSIFNETTTKNRDGCSGKQPLMPPKQTSKENLALQKNLPSSYSMPDYINLSKNDVQVITQQFSKTKHHDYYNWNSSDLNKLSDNINKNEYLQQKTLDPYPGKLNLKIKKTNENIDSQHTQMSSSPGPKSSTRFQMIDRPLPQVPH